MPAIVAYTIRREETRSEKAVPAQTLFLDETSLPTPELASEGVCRSSAFDGARSCLQYERALPAHQSAARRASGARTTRLHWLRNVQTSVETKGGLVFMVLAVNLRRGSFHCPLLHKQVTEKLRTATLRATFPAPAASSTELGPGPLPKSTLASASQRFLNANLLGSTTRIALEIPHALPRVLMLLSLLLVRALRLSLLWMPDKAATYPAPHCPDPALSTFFAALSTDFVCSQGCSQARRWFLAMLSPNPPSLRALLAVLVFLALHAIPTVPSTLCLPRLPCVCSRCFHVYSCSSSCPCRHCRPCCHRAL